MIDIVGDRNVFAEELRADAIVEKRALVEDRLAAPVPEHEAQQVEHGGRFEDHRVLAGRELFRAGGVFGFFRGDFGEFHRIEIARVGRVGLLPSGRIRRPAW